MEELTAFIIESEPEAERQPDGWECVVFDVTDEEEGREESEDQMGADRAGGADGTYGTNGTHGTYGTTQS